MNAAGPQHGSIMSARRRRSGRLVFWAFLVFIVVQGAVSVSLPPGWPAVWGRFILGLTCLAAVPCGLWLYRPPDKRPWWLLGAGELFWILSGVFTGFTTITGRVIMVPLHGVPLPVDTAFTLAGYLMFLGVMLCINRARSTLQVRGNTEAMIATLGLGMVGYTIAVEPVLASPQCWAEKIIALLPGMMDLAMLAATVRVLVGLSGGGLALGLLTVSNVLLFMSDMLGTREHIIGVSGGRPHVVVANALWLVAVVAVAGVPMHPSMVDATRAAPEDHLTLSLPRLVMVWVALVCPAVSVVIDHGDGRTNVWPAVVDGLLMAGFVAARARMILADLEQQTATLAELVATDHLTGLPNRRTVDALVESALRTPAPGGLVVAILDLDRFKRFNDEHGHPAGDRLLTETAAAWSRLLPPGAVLARFGGEEFLLLCPGTPSAEVEQVLGRMRGATPARQSFSAGLARWDGTETGPALIARADTALYRAKTGGRARTVPAEAIEVAVATG